MAVVDPAAMKKSSKYLNLEVGNHVREVKDLGFWVWSMELLIRCHSPMRKKPVPYTTWPLRFPIFLFLIIYFLFSFVSVLLLV